MAEPLSIAAAVVALVETCVVLCKEVDALRRRYKAAPEVFESVSRECQITKDILTSTRELLDGYSQRCSERMQERVLLSTFSSAVADIDGVLKEIAKETARFRITVDKHPSLGFRSRPAFLWRERKLKECLQKMRDRRATVSFTLDAIQMYA
jgi:hypothetical protein